jgi:putative membrane protein
MLYSFFTHFAGGNLMLLSRKLILAATISVLAVSLHMYAKASDTVSSDKVTPKASIKATAAETASLATIAAIDKNEIMLGVLAANKQGSAKVTSFGKMMINMHGNNLTQILEMAHGMHGFSLKGGAVDKISAQGMSAMMSLSGLQGKEFDKAYVEDMVKGHQAALDLIDTKLMKTAKSEEIKKFLIDTRAVVVQHLDDAKKLQDSLKS